MPALTPELASLFGVKIIESPFFTETKTREVRLTWRERLTSLRPWVRTRTESYEVPASKILQTPAGFMMHPETARRLRQEFSR